MRPPRPVLLLVRNLHLGGSERQLSAMVRTLDRRRFTPHVGCVQPEGMRGDEVRAAGVPLVRFPIRSLASWTWPAQGLRLLRYIRRERIALVHSFDVPMNVFGVPWAAAAGSAVVVSSQRAHRSLTPGLYTHMLRLTDYMVDATVVNCEAMRRHLIDEERIPRRNVYLCYNGIDTDLFSPGGRAQPPEFGGAPLVIGVICGLRAEKGLSALVEAFELVRGLRAGMKLVLVGSGVCLPDLEQLSRDLGIEGDVIFLPATQEVPRLLRGIDIFVLPSLSEALSNSLMEAMACGCAAVASRVGGNPEIVSDGVTGLLFDAGDATGLAGALQRLILDEPFRRRLANAGLRSVRERFSLAAAAQCMSDIYDQLL